MDKRVKAMLIVKGDNMRHFFCTICVLSCFFMTSCSSESKKADPTKIFNKEEIKKIESVSMANHLFDVVGCFGVSSLSVKLKGDKLASAHDYLRLEAANKGANTLNEIRVYRSHALNNEGVIVGEAYKCKK